MKTEKHPKSTLFQTASLFWDGDKQLPGTLSLTPKKLLFELDDAQENHSNLVISLRDIESVEFLLLFDFSRNGLKIKNKKGHFDLFVLDDPETFRWALMKAISGL